MEKMQKKAVSELVSYTMLIGITITLGILVSFWIYTQAKNPPLPQNKCDGVSIIVEDMACDKTDPNNPIFNAILVNKGRFTIDRINDKADKFNTEIGVAFPENLETVDINLVPNATNKILYSSSYANLGRLARVKFIPAIDSTLCPEGASERVTPQVCR